MDSKASERRGVLGHSEGPGLGSPADRGSGDAPPHNPAERAESKSSSLFRFGAGDLIEREDGVPEETASTATMHDSLEKLILLIERVAPGMRGSILLLDNDGVTLRHGAAPNLPAAYRRLIDGQTIGPAAGSCGTAAYRRERVIVRDIATDPLWANYRQAAEICGLAACWSTPIFNANGQVLGTFAMYYAEPREPAPVDIELTETAALLAANIISRARAVAALRAREAQFHALAESIPQLAWSADATGWIDWYNQRWYDYTGTTLEEMEGWGWCKVHDPEHVDRVVAGIQRSWDTGEPWEDTFPLRGKDGRYRWFLSRAQPIRDADGNVVRWFGTNTDITELREAELARDHALAEAEHANRAKSEFLAAMSHDLRTPLNAIGGYADLVEEGVYGPITDNQRGALARIRRAGSHLLMLINDILSFAKIEAGSLQLEITEFSANEVLAAAVAMVEVQAKSKGLSLLINRAADGVRVRADRERTIQILANLLTNAVKFTDAGSVTVDGQTGDHRVHIHVRDTGRGIPADRQAAIFEPFVQAGHSAEEQHQGVGLGLAISRELTWAMGGDLTVESVVARGSTFTLTLPRAANG